MDKLFRNLRLMDSRIKDRKERKLNGATISVADLHEAEQLARALIARAAYENVICVWDWSLEANNHFEVTVYWPED